MRAFKTDSLDILDSLPIPLEENEPLQGSVVDIGDGPDGRVVIFLGTETITVASESHPPEIELKREYRPFAAFDGQRFSLFEENPKGVSLLQHRHSHGLPREW